MEETEEKLEGGQDDGSISAIEHNKSAPPTRVNKRSGNRDGYRKGEAVFAECAAWCSPPPPSAILSMYSS